MKSTHLQPKLPVVLVTVEAAARKTEMSPKTAKTRLAKAGVQPVAVLMRGSITPAIQLFREDEAVPSLARSHQAGS